MTEDTPTSTGQTTTGESPGTTADPSVQERAVKLASDRPEVAAGAAFGGGLLLALILKRLAS